MTIKPINPSALYNGAPFGLSHATIDDNHGLVFVSGQVDWNSEYQVVNNNIESQTESALRNLKLVLEAANSSIESLLQLRIYVRGELSEHMENMVPILTRYLGATRPALTGVGVASLATPDTLVEIEAVAKILS